jgi:hypothetical protein
MRLMRFAFIGVFTMAAVITLAADEREAARAWHRQSWATWSSKTDLSMKTIERLWHIAMGPDGEDRFGQSIEHIDAQTLRHRKQILFVVSAGNGHCLDIFVLGNDGQNRNPVWRLNRLPEGGGICHEQMLPNPTAYARPQGDIVVQVPTEAAWITRKKNDPDSAYPISTALMMYTYRSNGSAYILATTQRLVTYNSETLNPQKCTMDEPCMP